VVSNCASAIHPETRFTFPAIRVFLLVALHGSLSLPLGTGILRGARFCRWRGLASHARLRRVRTPLSAQGTGRDEQAAVAHFLDQFQLPGKRHGGAFAKQHPPKIIFSCRDFSFHPGRRVAGWR